MYYSKQQKRNLHVIRPTDLIVCIISRRFDETVEFSNMLDEFRGKQDVVDSCSYGPSETDLMTMFSHTKTFPRSSTTDLERFDLNCAY